MENNELPELAKIAAVREQSQAIGEFLEWLQYEKKMNFCLPHYHDTEREEIDCRLHEGEFVPSPLKIQELLAEFFGIDLKKLENEKQEILKQLRENQEKGNESANE